jgi:hypothetical protein
MSIRRAIAFFASVLCAGAAQNSLPLQSGEKLTYRVSWAIRAGEIKIAAERDPTSTQPRLVVTTHTATRSVARLLLKFDADSRVTFDLATGRMLALEERSTLRDKETGQRVTFDYTKREATFIPENDPGKSRVEPMPAGDPADLIMGLLQTRTWDLKPGETRDALVLFEKDFYELTIHMARYEDLRIPLGTFRTVVLEPRMDKTPPKGMFKRGSSVRVWIAQDDHRLPVKFEVEFKIGTGTATLESYEGPASLPRATAEVR